MGVVCENCTLQRKEFLCHLSPAAAKDLKAITLVASYPAGAVLFMEKEKARGIFLICSGEVRLSVSSKAGKTLLLQIAKSGELMGLSASMSGGEYEATAETLRPAQVSFIARDAFLAFLHRFPEAFDAVTKQLNLQYGRACQQLRTIGLSATAHEKLARLLLDWSSGTEQIKVSLTHEQIASCLGSARETVTRALSDFKNKQLVTLRGATVVIPSRSALKAVTGD